MPSYDSKRDKCCRGDILTFSAGYRLARGENGLIVEDEVGELPERPCLGDLLHTKHHFHATGLTKPAENVLEIYEVKLVL